MISFIPKFFNDFECDEALAVFGTKMMPKDTNAMMLFLNIKIPFLEVKLRTR